MAPTRGSETPQYNRAISSTLIAGLSHKSTQSECAALCGPVPPCVALCGPVWPIGLFPEVLLDYSPRAYWIIPRGPIGLFPEVLLDYSPLSLILRVFSNISFFGRVFQKTTRRRQRGQRRPQLLKYRNIKIPQNTPKHLK